MAPAVEFVAELEDLRLDDGAALLLRAEVGARQEYLSDGEAAAARFVPGLADLVVEEGGGNLHMQAGAVTRFAVGVDGAPVPDIA